MAEMPRIEAVPDSAYDDDLYHPLAYLGKIDVSLILKNGGHYAVVAAAPLRGDPVTKARLLRKLQNYLADFGSPYFLSRSGPPRPGNLKIMMKMHPGTDQEIFDFLDECREWLDTQGVELHISFIRSTVS